MKCRDVLQVRRNNMFKYSDIQLPRELNATDGYHASCYRTFTALGKKYFTSRKYSTDSTPSTSTAQILSPVTESINVLPAATTISVASPGPSTMVDLSSNSTCQIIQTPVISGEPSDTSTSTILSPSTIEEQSNVSISQISAIIVTQPSDLSSSVSADPSSTLSSLQSNTLDPSIDNTEKKCVFCDKNWKKVNGIKQKLMAVSTEHFRENFQQYALDLGDDEILNKLQDKNLMYHGFCERAYRSKHKSMKDTSNLNWHKSRELRKSVIEDMHMFIEDSVITNNRSLMLSSLCSMYNMNLKKSYADHGIPSCQDIELRHFESSVLTPLIKNQKVKIINYKK